MVFSQQVSSQQTSAVCRAVWAITTLIFQVQSSMADTRSSRSKAEYGFKHAFSAIGTITRAAWLQPVRMVVVVTPFHAGHAGRCSPTRSWCPPQLQRRWRKPKSWPTLRRSLGVLRRRCAHLAPSAESPTGVFTGKLCGCWHGLQQSQAPCHLTSLPAVLQASQLPWAVLGRVLGLRGQPSCRLHCAV